MSKENPFAFGTFPKAFTEKENRQYFEILKDGDKSARNKLIEHNLRLVAHIVKKFENKACDTDDLISIGTIGLIKGIDTYKNNKYTKITTYAARCIQNEILMHFRSNKKNQNNISINDSIGFDKEGNDLTILNTIYSGDQTSEEFVEENEIYEELRKSLSILSERERKVIEMRNGFGCTPRKQWQVAQELGISRSYVSRIEKAAIKKIICFLRSKDIVIDKKAILSERPKKTNSPVDYRGQIKDYTYLPQDIKDKIQEVHNMSETERVNYFADEIIEGNKTVKELSYLSGYSYGQIKYILNNKLSKINSGKFEEVKQKLKNQPKKSFGSYKKNKPQNNEELDVKKASREKVSDKKDDLFSYYPDYNKELVLQVLDSLKKVNKRIIELRYGQNGNPVTDIKAIVKILKEEFELEIDYPVLQMRIVNIRNSIRKKIEKVLVGDKNINEIPSQELENSENPLLECPKENSDLILPSYQPQILNYEQQEKLKKWIGELQNPLEQVVLFLKLGYNNNRYYSEEQIARKLNIESPEEVQLILKTGLANIILHLKESQNLIESTSESLDLKRTLVRNSDN